MRGKGRGSEAVEKRRERQNGGKDKTEGREGMGGGGCGVPRATCAPVLLYFLPISARVRLSINFPIFLPLS